MLVVSIYAGRRSICWRVGTVWEGLFVAPLLAGSGLFPVVVGLLARFCARVFVTFRSPVRVSGRGGAVRIRPQEFFFSVLLVRPPPWFLTRYLSS